MDVFLYVICALFLFFVLISFISYILYLCLSQFSLKKIDIGRPLDECARELLKLGAVDDVEVKVIGFFKSMFLPSPSYSVRRKKLYVSRRFVKRPTLKRLADLSRSVGFAKMYADGKKGIWLERFSIFSNTLPFFLLPLMVVGLIIDYTLSPVPGVLLFRTRFLIVTLVLTIIGLILCLFAIIVSFATAGKVNMAYEEGHNLILKLGVLSEDQEKKMEKTYKRIKILTYLNTMSNIMAMIILSLRAIFLAIALAIKLKQ